MISIQRIGLQHLIAACAASLSLACSSSSPAPATGGGTDSGGENDATMTPPSDAGTPPGPDTSTTTPPPDSGTTPPSEAGPAPLSCTSYCTAVMAACTGANAQYQSMAECMNACPSFPVGMAGDTSGNTLGCRTTHAMLAASATNPHCWHAGPLGYGACGDECTGFCTLATTWCTPDGGFDGGAPPYPDDNTCLTDCAGFMKINSGAADGGVGLDGGFFALGPPGGNTLDCRGYHLGNALLSHAQADQQTHCAHIGVTSVTCK